MPRSDCDFCCNPIELARTQSSFWAQVVQALCALIRGSFVSGQGDESFHLVSAGASQDLTNVFDGEGVLRLSSVFNVSGSPVFCKFYDAPLSAPPVVGTTIPILTQGCPGNPAGAGSNWDEVSQKVTQGLWIALVTGLPDTNTTSVPANNVTVNIGYRNS